METEVSGYIRSITPDTHSVTLELIVVSMHGEDTIGYLELLDLINKNCIIKFRTIVSEGE